MPGPPPLEGLRSARTAPNLPATVVAPAPNVIRDYTRNGVSIDTVIAPAPSVSRSQFLTAPNLSATLIPPVPSLTREHTLVAPALGSAVIPPAPTVSRDHTLYAPSLSPSVVAPAPSVISRKCARSAPAVGHERNSTRSGCSEPRALERARTDGEPRRSTSTGDGARTHIHTKSEVGFARTFSRGTAAFRQCRARYATAGQRKHSRPFAGSRSSAANAVRQRVVHEQRDRQDLRSIGRCAPTAIG